MSAIVDAVTGPCPACAASPPERSPVADGHLETATSLHRMGLLDAALTALRCPELAAAPWPDRVRVELAAAQVLAGLGDLARARHLLEGELRDDLDPADEAAQRAQARLENALGVIARTLGHADEAERRYAAAHARLAPLEPDDDFASLLHNLAGLCHARDRSAEGLAHAREGLALRVRLHGEHHVLVAADQANLAGLLYDVGGLDEAAGCFRRALATFTEELGADDMEVAVCLSGLASLAAQRGDRAEAEALYRRSVAIKAARCGADHLDTLVTEYNLARLLHEDARPDEARKIIARVVDGLTGRVDHEHRVFTRARQLAAVLDGSAAGRERDFEN